MSSPAGLAACVAGSDLYPLPGRRPDGGGIDKRPVARRVAVHPHHLPVEDRARTAAGIAARAIA